MQSICTYACHIYSRWAIKLKCASICKQNDKVTYNYVTMYLSYVYMCRDYLQCQKQTICVITTCVCTIHAFALLYANTKIILISVQCFKESYIVSRAVCEFYVHNMMFNTRTLQYYTADWCNSWHAGEFWDHAYSHVVQVPNQCASIMCMQFSTLS